MPEIGASVTLGHGAGGRLTRDLLAELILPELANPILDRLDDSAVFDLRGNTAFSTDSFVVKPLFFPGGDIGKLAVCGTVNDLCMVGATACFLSLAFVVEEGFPIASLKKIVRSIRVSSRSAQVKIVTGDFKVVEKGACDGIYLNTSGVGIIPRGLNISSSNAHIGDVVIINGSAGDHEAAVINARQGYGLDACIKSDCAPLAGLMKMLLSKNQRSVHVLRDPTRGGISAALNEIAAKSAVEIVIDEQKVPVRKAVRSLCALLGMDPLAMANEGKVLVLAAPSQAKSILNAIRSHPLGKNAAIIGRVTAAASSGSVTVNTRVGTQRLLEMPSGEQLPRIC